MHSAKRILVTGGAGFIGSHLCKRLIGEGHEVICLDDLSTGQISNICCILDQPNFKWIKHDVLEPVMFEVDEIYNLACPASPAYFMKDPIKTIQTNIIGVINMLNLAEKFNAKILQASTSEVYGDPQVHPQIESYWGNVNPVGPRACYDEGKRCAETVLFDYHRTRRVDIKVVRIFNTYGPHMREDDGRVVSNFIVQAIRNKDITIYGEGCQTRSFCYIDDLVEGMVSFMRHPCDLAGPVNLGNPDEMTIRELAETIIRLTGSSSKIVYQPLPADDPQLRRPDIRLARDILGWEPKIGLQAGLSSTVEYFKSLLLKGR
jgi:UDP-glucuronate decarboxylase